MLFRNENHHVRKTVKHYKVPSPITEDNDEASESSEIKSSQSSSFSSSSFPSKDKSNDFY